MPSSNPIDRVLQAIVPRAVGAVDMDEVLGGVDVDHLVSEVDVDGVIQRVDIQALMERVDLDALLTRVDLDGLLTRLDVDAVVSGVDISALIGRVDIDALIQRVDIDGLIQRVDVNALIQQVDLNALIGQLDVDALVQRVDVDSLVQRVDLDALIGRLDVDGLIARVDVPAVMERAHIDEIVSNASRGVTTRLLDLVRRQLAAVDLVLISLVDRIFRRPRETASLNQSLTGWLAGGISRLAAYFVDLGTIALSYALTVAVCAFLFGLFTGDKLEVDSHAWIYASGYATFAFFYYWIGLSIAGRSIGKGLVGLRVVGKNGDPITPGRAAVRTLVYPFSFILGLGLIPIVTGKRRRALHDWAAGSTVLYDWGDRPAVVSGPVSAWLRRKSADEGLPLESGSALVAVPSGDAAKRADPAA